MRSKSSAPDGAKPTSRRALLKTLGATGAAAAAIVGGSTLASASPLPTVRVRGAQRVVYRLTTRGHRACNACKVHHRYTVGASLAALDKDRAHPGCNCPIVRQIVSVGEFHKLFPEGRGTVDLRSMD